MFSPYSYGGNGGWRYFPSFEALESIGMVDEVLRDKGATQLDEEFIATLREQKSVTPKKGERYYRRQGYVGQEEHLAEIRAAIKNALRER